MWVNVYCVLLVLLGCEALDQFNGKESKIESKESVTGLSLLHLQREKRQLGLGNLLNAGGNQNQRRRGPSCQTPNRQPGKCLQMNQCVLRELDDNYIKNKGYLCLIRPQGPVGVCCPDSVAKPVVYREGMFGIKNTQFSRTGDEQGTANPDLPEDVEMLS